MCAHASLSPHYSRMIYIIYLKSLREQLTVTNNNVPHDVNIIYIFNTVPINQHSIDNQD